MDRARIGYHTADDGWGRTEGVKYSALPRVLDARVVNRGDRFGDAASGRVVMLAEVTDLEFAEEEVGKMREEEVEEEMEEESGEECGGEGPESGNREGVGIENVEEAEGTDGEEDEDAASEENEESRHSLGGFEVIPDEEDVHLGPTLKAVRIGPDFCLVVEQVGDASWVPPVFKRVGCLRGKEETVTRMGDWETRVVKLV